MQFIILTPFDKTTEKSAKARNFLKEINMLFPTIDPQNLSLIITFQQLPVTISEAKTTETESAKDQCQLNFFEFA